MWLKSLFLKVNRSEQSWIFKNKYLISIFFVTVKAIYNWLLEIELFKKQKQNKKKNQNCIKSGLFQFIFVQQKM